MKTPPHCLRATALVLASLAVSACTADAPTPPAAPPGEVPLLTVGAGLIATSQIRGNLGVFKFETEYQGFDFELKTRGNADVITLSATGGPGSHTGWHYHPGPAIVIVRRGTVTSYVADEQGCRKTVYPAGTALIEGTTPHTLINEGSADIELSVVFLTPAGAAQRIDAPDPGTC